MDRRLDIDRGRRYGAFIHIIRNTHPSMNKRNFGLGDLAYWAFRPLVHFVDYAWGTDLRNCEVCKKRMALWNDLVSVPRWVAYLIGLAMSIMAAIMLLRA